MVYCTKCGSKVIDIHDESCIYYKKPYDLIYEIRKIFQDGTSIIEKKNQDYATSDDPFKNFRSAEILSISVEQAILIRTLDKMSRIGNCIKKDSTIVIEETVEDTILDAINYLALLLAYRRYNIDKNSKL